MVSVYSQNDPNWVPPASAQKYPTLDPEVYLQGTFVEVGIAQSGSCGTFGPTPPGYHGWYPGVGFVADYGLDGWGVGTPPRSGDYFIPGIPEERWVVEWSVGGGERNFNNSTLMGDNDVPQTSLVNTSAGTTNSCVWTGTATFGAESVLVRQEVTFEDSNPYFVFKITLTNTGTIPLESVEYMRNVDPDQGTDLGVGPLTLNYVTHQPGWVGSGDTALVIGKLQPTMGSIPLGLYTVHPNAVVSTEGFTNMDPDAILNSPVTYPEATPNYDDEAIALAYRFPSLAPGESISFQYAYILNEAAILDPPQLEGVPVANWSIYVALGLMIIFVFTVIRLRK